MSSKETRITDPKTGGQKGRKPERYDLFPYDALDELARVYGEGASKYEDDNWLKGYSWRLSLGALGRHISKFAQGVDVDDETGCLHLAHAAWHCLTLMTFHMRGLGTDDRAKVGRILSAFEESLTRPDNIPVSEIRQWGPDEEPLGAIYCGGQNGPAKRAKPKARKNAKKKTPKEPTCPVVCSYGGEWCWGGRGESHPCGL